MDGVAALPLGFSDIGNKRKITCSGLAANDGFIYYSYDLLSYDDDEDDDDKMRPEDAESNVLTFWRSIRSASWFRNPCSRECR